MAMQIIHAGKKEPMMLTDGAPEHPERKIAGAAIAKTDKAFLIPVISLALVEPGEPAGWLPAADSAADCR